MKVCHNCDEPARPGKSRCANCAQVNAERDRRRRLRNMTAGLCLNCSEPVASGKRRCSPCLLRAADLYYAKLGIPRETTYIERGGHEDRGDGIDRETAAEARRESSGNRCRTCRLLLPCGGHKTAADYASERISE